MKREMSVREMQNMLRRFRYDPEHRWGKQGFTVNNIAALSGCFREHILGLRDYGYIKGKPFLARMRGALERIRDGEVTFHRLPQPYRKDGKRRKLREGEALWRTELHDAPEIRPPPQEKLVAARDYQRWALCRTCEGGDFAPVVMNGSGFYVCRACCGPTHWRSLGARRPDAVERLEMFEPRVRADLPLV